MTELLAVEPVVTSAVVDVQPEKHTFKYQPKYPEGHELAGQAMGGEQVIEYDGTAEDLGNKMVEQNVLLQAEMRRLKLANATTHPDADDDEEFKKAPSRSGRPAAIAPRDLTEAELLDFSRGIIDPARAQQVLDKAIQARFGASPERLSLIEKGIQNLRDFIEGNKFRQLHPAEASSLETRKALLSWCDANDKDYTCANFELALKRLKKAGLLSEVPIAAEGTEGKSHSQADDVALADSGAAATQPSRRPVGIRTTALGAPGSPGTAARTPVTTATLTRAEFLSMTLAQVEVKAKNDSWKAQANAIIAKIPYVEQMPLLRDPNFVKKINLLG